MKISHNWLQKYFTKPIPSPERLDELFTFHAFEVEGVEKVNDENGQVIDTVLDLKVLPDRAHHDLCHRGIAGEVFSMTEMAYAEIAPVDVTVSTEGKPSITIEADNFCRRYVGRYVEIEKIGDATPEIQDALNAIGQRSINAIVDATNYVMFDIGQPLHAFDADKVKGSIVVRQARKGEKIVLLESSASRPQGENGQETLPQAGAREIELSISDHVIADDEGPLAIAGVKGGKRAAITADTRRLILESANFEPTTVRRTSTKYDLRSESSKRYENEITPELAMSGMTELSALILREIPTAKFGPIVDVYPKKAVQTVIEIDPRYISKRLGIEVPLEMAKGILENMGITIIVNGRYPIHDKSVEDNSSVWQLTIPFSRLDLTIPDDIVEEVGRIYGYENVKGVSLARPVEGVAILPSYYLSEKMKNVLIAQGYSEVSLYSLVAHGEVETAKPLARDKAFARANLTDGMITCVQKNVLNADLIGLEAVKVFEIGRVFDNTGEYLKLCLGAAQVKKVKGVNGKKLLGDVVGILGTALGVDDSVFSTPESLVEKGSVSVMEIDLNEILKSYKLPKDATYGDLGFGPTSPNIYQKLSPYPFIVRDVAVFVPASTSADHVWNVILDGMKGVDVSGGMNAADLLARHSLFDTFEKDGKVSYAFRMVFQSMERTLTDDEVNKIMTAIYAALKGPGWEVR